MKTEQIIILVVAFFLGMLLLNMVKNVCGCELKEGFSPQEANAAANKLSNACEWKPKTVSLFKQTLALGGCGVDFSLKNNLFQQDDVNELKNNFWCNDASELLDACSGCAGWREEGGANILNRGCSPDDSGGVGSLDAPRPDVDAPGPEDVDPGGGNSKDSNSKGSNNKDGSEGSGSGGAVGGEGGGTDVGGTGGGGEGDLSMSAGNFEDYVGDCNPVCKNGDTCVPNGYDRTPVCAAGTVLNNGEGLHFPLYQNGQPADRYTDVEGVLNNIILLQKGNSVSLRELPKLDINKAYGYYEKDGICRPWTSSTEYNTDMKLCWAPNVCNNEI